MKTLDEVINAMERCSIPHYFDCNGCPYEDADAETGCRSEDRDADAIHYLRHLQEYYEMSRTHDYKNLDDNPPLTWDELKQMKGQPVWVEDSNDKGEWVLLSGTEDDEYLYFVYRNCAEYKIYRDEQGERWQAYRKERE